MDTHIIRTSSDKKKLISVGKSLIIILSLLFIGCIIITGVLVYHFSSKKICSNIPTLSNINDNDKHFEELIYTNKQFSQQQIILESTTNGIILIEENTENETDNELILSTTETIIRKTDDVNIINNLRLPQSIWPDYYKIKLIPFIQEGNFTFLGDVIILINVTEFCNNITLHTNDLIIDNVEIFEHSVNKNIIPIKKITNEIKQQFLIIHLYQTLNKGNQYTIHIKFKGILNDLFYGFYRSSYKEGNITKWLAATQFQATEARSAFPCFDEPIFKAKFQISLGRLKNMTTISNMRKTGESIPVNGLDDYLWDDYEESVPMSTYLIAFIISDFVSLKNGNVAVWCRKSALAQTKYSLDITPKILKFYEEFFDIKYPLPKIDMIGLPDFPDGAMENWGLITYRESVLFYKEKISNKESMQRIAHVVAHELAHQWFGNLVTPIWWSDLWLNEGFATYMEFLGADSVNPNLNELDQFINELHEAFALDALKTSHQISVVVNNPNEINDIFDRISYSKGAAIIRMMQNFLSMNTFRRGLKNYLSVMMYKNAEQDDLWKFLTEQSHKEKVLNGNITVKEIMDTWTLQTGYPVVHVKRNYKNKSIHLHQSRFLLHKNNTVSNNTFWWIPITYMGPKNMPKFCWLPKESDLVIDNVNVSDNDWLLVNINQTGYYRVNYDEKNWHLIISQLKKTNGHLAFDIKNRAQLINDAMNLASAGYLDYEIALNILVYLQQEREYVPWNAAFSSMEYLYEMFIRTQHFDKFKAFMLKLMKNFYKEVGFKERDDDDHLLIYSRFNIYEKSCKLGYRDCIIQAVQQFENWRNSPNPDKHNSMSENMWKIVYCTAISVGGEEEWNFVWQKYLNANVDNEKEILLSSLGCSKEIWILSRFLEWSITENSGIRKHDITGVFSAITSNPIGQDLAYRFMKNNWNRIKNYVGSTSLILNNIVRCCTSKFNTEIEIDNFKQFLNMYQEQFGIAYRTALQSIEQGEANIKWMKDNFNKIVNSLSSINI